MVCLKLPNSLKKPIKKILHLKMLTLQNVKFEMSEYRQQHNLILNLELQKESVVAS